MSIHPWTHKSSCMPSDPINIIFRNISLQDIERFLLNKKWGKSKVAGNQFVPESDTDLKVKQHLQLVLGSILKRHHVRLWNIKGVRDLAIAGNVKAVKNLIIASVHKEYLSGIGPHTVADFDLAKTKFAKTCEDNRNWRVNRDVIALNNEFHGYKQPSNNGRATLVEPI